MPPKKKKNNAGKSKPHAGAPRSKQSKKKQREQPSLQTTANGDHSPTTQDLEPGKTRRAYQRQDDTARPAAPTTMNSETRNAQTQSLLFKLPTEIRVMIYDYVLDIKVLEIGTRRQLRCQSQGQRVNVFKLENFSSKHFTLVKTCTEVKKEVEKFILPKLAFTFDSTHTFACFVGRRTGPPYDWDGEVNGQTFELLERVSNVEVVIQKHRRYHEPLGYLSWVEQMLERPLTVEFVDYDRDDDYTSRACRSALRRWNQRKQALEELQAGEA